MLRCSKESAAPCACRRGLFTKKYRFDRLSERCFGIAKKVSLPEHVEGAWLQRDIASTGSANVLRCSKESAAPCACRRDVVAKRHRFDGLSERCCGVARKVPLPVLVEGAWLQRIVASTGSANGAAA